MSSFDELLAIFKAEDLDSSIRTSLSTGRLEELTPGAAALDGCTQDERYHAEGDALAHTILVLGEMRKLLPENPVALLAAWLHDFGKPATRWKRDDGRISFYRHEEIGAKMVPDICRGLGVNDSDSETIEWLVRNHMKAHRFPQMREFKQRELLVHPEIDLLIALQEADSFGSIKANGEPRDSHREIFELARKRLQANS